jgi:hypothetical protein
MLYDFFQNYSGVVIALSSGFFGATFFMLVQLSGRLSGGSGEDAREMWNWNFLVLRSLVGIGGALIIYFFFESGLLEGSIWPDLAMLNYEKLEKCCEDGAQWRIPNKDLSLLVIWSFLAGYSQTLVPSILVKTETKAGYE